MKKFLLLSLFLSLATFGFSQVTIYSSNCDNGDGEEYNGTPTPGWSKIGNGNIVSFNHEENSNPPDGYWHLKNWTSGSAAVISDASTLNISDYKTIVVRARATGQNSGAAPKNLTVKATCNGTTETITLPISTQWTYTWYDFALPAATFDNCPANQFTVEYYRASTDAGVFIEDIEITGILSPLPINLESFSGTQRYNNVELVWRTASEINNDYFTIDRSSNGARFESVGKVQGAGTSSIAQDYNFTDESPLRGTNYYRLTQHDLDGQSESFNVISIDFEGKPTISVVPTHVNDVLTISFEQKQTTSQLTVYNITGQKVYTSEIEAGTINLEIDAASFSAGQYFVHITNGQNVETVKFIKQ